MARWYLAGIGYENGELRPGGAPGTADTVCLVPGIERAHAYDESTATVLIGLGLPVAPDSWTPLTMEEAQHHYEAVLHRAPTEQEVYP